MFHWLTSLHLSTYFSPLFCSLRQSVKSPFVGWFGVIVSCGGQGYHSSLVINAGLSALVDSGMLGPSSWACASSYHPGGPAPALLKQTISVMMALQISHSHVRTHMFFSQIKRLCGWNTRIRVYLSVRVSNWFKMFWSPCASLRTGKILQFWQKRLSIVQFGCGN